MDERRKSVLARTEQPNRSLEQLFTKIMAQQNMRGVVCQDMTAEQKLSYANQCVLALSVEVSELASSWPFASWKTNAIDQDNIEREIVDCVFFLVNIACCFDIKPSDLVSRFNVVLENNYRRIEERIHKDVQY